MTSPQPPQPPRPLPRSLVPLPGESLAGLLLRLSARLRLTPHRVARLCGLACRSDVIPQEQLRGLPEETAEHFATATRMTPADVHALTLQPLAERYPPLARLRSAASGGGVGPTTAWAINPVSRFCPDCLRGDGTPVQEAFGGAWQLRWHLPVVFACVQHGRLVESACPVCGQQLSGRVVSRYNLAQLPNVAGLDPRQCRNQAPGVARKFRGRATACGARLDTAATAPQLPAEDLAHVLATQHRLDGVLQPTGPSSASDGPQYFRDLLFTARLVMLGWPAAESMVPSGGLAAQLDQLVRSDRERRARPGTNPHRTAPDTPARTGALLAAAEAVLGDQEPTSLRERVEPLAREAFRKSMSTTSNVTAASGASDVLLKATAPRAHGFHRRVASGPPDRAGSYRLAEIPPFLPTDWFDTHLAELTARLPVLNSQLKASLRTGASLALAELVQGQKWIACAPMLDIPESAARRALNVLGRAVAARGLWPTFENGVQQIADHLHHVPNRTDYARRRELTRDWQMPQSVWRQLCAHVGWLHDPSPLLGEIIVWSAVNQANHVFSPTLTTRRDPNTASAVVTARSAMTNPNRSTSGQRALWTGLHAYAAALGRACDEGEDLARVPLPSLPPFTPTPRGRKPTRRV